MTENHPLQNKRWIPRLSTFLLSSHQLTTVSLRIRMETTQSEIYCQARKVSMLCLMRIKTLNQCMTSPSSRGKCLIERLNHSRCWALRSTREPIQGTRLLMDFLLTNLRWRTRWCQIQCRTRKVLHIGRTLVSVHSMSDRNLNERNHLNRLRMEVCRSKRMKDQRHSITKGHSELTNRSMIMRFRGERATRYLYWVCDGRPTSSNQTRSSPRSRCTKFLSVRRMIWAFRPRLMIRNLLISCRLTLLFVQTDLHEAASNRVKIRTRVFKVWTSCMDNPCFHPWSSHEKKLSNTHEYQWTL